MAGLHDTGGRGLRLFILALALLASATGRAQSIDPRDGRYALNEDGSMPAWVVPVLRLVSSTHVEPTTGLVVAEGLVLVPLGFASEGDEVIVLDGGTDIVRDGRPAHLKDYFPAEALQILSVPGLRRAPAPFADEALSDGTYVELTAFPPAERIAEGDPPLHAAATVTVFGASADPAVSGDTPLPNVTGPLLDECGNVAAYSLAHDVQTMASHPGTRYRWRGTLLAVLTRLGVTPAPAEAAPEPPAPAPTEEPAAPPEPEATDDASDAAAPVAEPEPEPAAPEPEETLDIDTLPPIETISPEPSPPPAPEPRTTWPWLLAGLALIAGGLYLHRRRRQHADGAAGGTEPGTADDPDDAGAEPIGPPPEMDRRLVLRGVLADGSRVEAGCAVSSRAVNVVIGRGTAADLALPGAAVSRQHARLNGTPDALTVTDLGSSNGTSVNGVPCLEGEILYVETGDTLVLGDARLAVSFEAPEGAGR
jgi:LPXTG-motif cell wall-anchored protein